MNVVANIEIEEACCRICLDTEPSKNLVSPCNCMGSTKFVHQACILEYATKNNKIEEDEATGQFKLKCEICNFVMGVQGEKKYGLHDCEGITKTFK